MTHHDSPIPLFAEAVHAGFPSPAQDFEEARLSLDQLMIARPEATYLLRVRGDSMCDAGVRDGDIVVADRSISPLHGHMVIAEVDNNFTIKTLYRRGGQVSLRAANPAFPPITFAEEQQLVIFGVVTWVVHRTLW